MVIEKTEVTGIERGLYTIKITETHHTSTIILEIVPSCPQYIVQYIYLLSLYRL